MDEIVAMFGKKERRQIRKAIRSELERPAWGVACAAGVVAAGITFEEAIDVVRKLDADGKAGAGLSVFHN